MDIYQLTTYEASLIICAFIFLNITALAMTGLRAKVGVIPWVTLGIYSLFSALHAVAREVSIGVISTHHYVVSISLICSMAALCVYSAQCCDLAKIKRISIRSVTVLTVLFLLIFGITRCINAAIILCMHLYAAQAMYLCVKEHKIGRFLASIVSCSIVCIGIGSLCIDLNWHISDNAMLALLCDAALCIMVVGCLTFDVVMSHILRRHIIPAVYGMRVEYPFRAYVFIITALALSVTAPFLVHRSAVSTDRHMRDTLISHAQTAAMAIDASAIHQLTTTPKEVMNSVWQAQHIIINRLQNKLTNTRYVYLLRYENGAVKFLVDGTAMGDPDFQPPGKVYDDAPAEAVFAAKTGRPAIYGPYRDRWGTWVTALAPIMLDNSGKVAALLCIDSNGNDWKQAVVNSKLYTLWLLLAADLLVVLLLASIFIVEMNERLFRKTAYALEHSKKELESIVNNLPGYTYMQDTQGRYLVVNNNLCQLFGRSREQIIGKAASDFIVMKMAEEVAKIHAEVIRSKETRVHRFSGQMMPNDTRNKHFMSTMVPMVNDEGSIYGLVCLTLDVTEMLDTREALNRVNRELENAMKSRRENYRQLRAMMDAIPNPVFSRDSIGNYLSANKAFAEFVGVPEVEIIGRRLPDIWGVDIARNLTENEDFTGNTERVELQIPLRRADGQMRDIVIRKGAFYNDAGEMIGVVGLMTDITNLKLMENELRISEQRLQQIVNSLSDWVWDIDQQNCFTYVSDRVEDVLGYLPSDLMNKPMMDLMPSDDADRLLKAMASVNGLYTPIRQHLCSMRNSQGLECVMEITGVPVYSDDGQFTGYRGVARDVTERVQAQRHNAQLLSQLQALNEDLVDFVHITSHELKGPVRAIGSLADMIYADSKQLLTGESLEMLEMLTDRSQRLYKILDAYQQLARVHTSPERILPVRMEEIVHEVLRGINLPSNIKIQVFGEWPVVQVKREQIVSALIHLVVNSVTFMDKPDGLVEIVGSQDDAEFTVKVKDNGPGIDPKYHKQVFQGFRRALVGDQLDRSGIGLALVRRVVQAHGGRIGIDSTLNNGTTIWFTIPKISTDTTQSLNS